MKPARGPKTICLAIIVVESQGLPTMKCQAKFAKAICVDLFRHLADTQQSWNPDYWQLGLGT